MFNYFHNSHIPKQARPHAAPHYTAFRNREQQWWSLTVTTRVVRGLEQLKEWKRDLQVAHWTGEGHTETLPWGSTGRWQELTAGSRVKEQKEYEKAETNYERQENSFVRHGCSHLNWEHSSVQHKMCSNAFHDSGCFPWQSLLYWELQNYRSQWLSVHNVGTVNYKLQEPDINLALLGLSMSEVIWRQEEEVNFRQ